jgi:membrane protein required for beta-lactamase induction
METTAEVFWIKFYLLGTPVGSVLFGLIALQVLVKRPDG